MDMTKPQTLMLAIVTIAVLYLAARTAFSGKNGDMRGLGGNVLTAVAVLVIVGIALGIGVGSSATGRSILANVTGISIGGEPAATP